MILKHFQKLIPKIENSTLPGVESQFKLAPIMRKKLGVNLNMLKLNPKKSAVLMLLYPNNKNGELVLIFMLRKTYKGVHSNQICFPGGKSENQDKNLMQTALRETFEEIGVQASKIKIIKALTKVYIPPSNFLVQPYLGLLTQKPNFVLEKNEVEKLIEIPLHCILDDSYISSKNITTSYAKNINVPIFKLNENVIWGATAMMLSEIKDLLRLINN